MVKLKQQLDDIKRVHSKVSAKGQLYAKRADLKGSWNSITLYTLFVSNEDTHMIRPHIFKKKALMTAAQWSDWFAAPVHLIERDETSPLVERLTHIHHRYILPGLAVRTQKQWQVEKIIGWIPNAIHKPEVVPVVKRRNKAKSKRRARG